MTPQLISKIETLFASTMAADHPEVGLVFPNIPIPNAMIRAYIYVVASTETFPIALGSGANSRNVGFVQIDVYGPKDQGSGPTSDIAFSITKAMSRKQLAVGDEGALTLRDGSVKDMGETDEEYRQMVRVPYVYDFELV